MEEKKLFLLDAYALIYRAYYALIRAPRVTSDGRNTSAIFGFCNTLDEILRKENPQYMAVCFDPAGGHTFRHEAYADYKAQRDKQPEDITAAVPIIKDIIRAYGIQVVEVPRYEADDVIGTLATEAQKDDFLTYMMTLDKDYGQLVTDRVLMYCPPGKGRGIEVRGPKEVCEKYGVSNPAQVIDLLALEGDASDNVPGCPGVGEKTAVKLIAEFGSVENLLANTDKLKGAMRGKVEDNVEQIRFSKWLVTIKTDVPLDVTPTQLLRTEPDIPRLRQLYKDLEFRTFLTRLDGESASTAPAEQPQEPQPAAAPSPMGSLFDDTPEAPAMAGQPADVQCTIAGGAEDTVRYAEECLQKNPQYLAISVLADGEEAMTAKIRGLAMIYENAESALYVDLEKDTKPLTAETLEPLLNNPAITIVSHDVKRDILLLRRLNIPLTAPYFDTSVAHYVLKPETGHDIRDVAMTVLGLRLEGYELNATARRKPLTGSLQQIAATVAARARAVLQLRPVLADMLVKDGTDTLFRDIELPFTRVLADMEWTGVSIDTQVLAEMARDLTGQLDDLERRCHELAGEVFNVGSPSQVGEVLFGKLQIDPKAKRTKTGQFSTTEEILEKHRRQWPIVDLILQYRSIKKLLSTYILTLPTLRNPVDGRIHTTYNQTVTATGRISSTNPNLQNIPIRTDLGREIRRAFVADPGCLIMSADYSQIELRLMACFSKDETMVQAFNSDQDIHRATAARIYHIPLADVTDNQRRNAKTANFGIIYGISAFGLSERLGIPRAESKMLIDGYFRTFPGVQAYMNQAIEHAREKGYVTTIMGRKRYLPDINSRNAMLRSYAERNAINAPLQGSAADIIKIAMIHIADEMQRRGLRSKMIMQVHDELIFNVVPDELEQMQELVVKLMEGAWHSLVPLTVSAGVGQNWLEAH